MVVMQRKTSCINSGFYPFLVLNILVNISFKFLTWIAVEPSFSSRDSKLEL